MAPLANDPIMLGTSIRSFRHLEYQNPSIISEDIGRARMGNNSGGGVRGVGSEEEEEEEEDRSTVVLEDRIIWKN